MSTIAPSPPAALLLAALPLPARVRLPAAPTASTGFKAAATA